MLPAGTLLHEEQVHCISGIDRAACCEPAHVRVMVLVLQSTVLWQQQQQQLHLCTASDACSVVGWVMTA
jgi:hypothetical protein